MDEIAPCIAFASSRTVVEGMFDSGLESFGFDTVTSVDGKSAHLSAQGCFEVLCLYFSGDRNGTLMRLLVVDVFELWPLE